jgi:hypothetical protein
MRQAAGGVKLNNEVAVRLKVRCHDVPPAPSEPAASETTNGLSWSDRPDLAHRREVWLIEGVLADQGPHDPQQFIHQSPQRLHRCERVLGSLL